MPISIPRQGEECDLKLAGSCPAVDEKLAQPRETNAAMAEICGTRLAPEKEEVQLFSRRRKSALARIIQASFLHPAPHPKPPDIHSSP